jgi:hypothetical protein
MGVRVPPGAPPLEKKMFNWIKRLITKVRWWFQDAKSEDFLEKYYNDLREEKDDLRDR